MKKLFLTLFLPFLMLASCNDDNDDNSRECDMYVASQRIYFNEAIGEPELFYLVKYDQKEQWTYVRDIKDLQYETGFEYLIRARITEYKPEPGVQIDGDPTLYECLKVLSKEEKTSANLPGNTVDE